MKRTIMIISIAGVLVFPTAAQETDTQETEKAAIPAGADGVVKLVNLENSGWRITEARGEGINASGAGQTNAVLAVGGRYHFDLSAVNTDYHALDIRDRNGRVLFSQETGKAASDLGGADPEVDGEGITFTLTEELAGRIATFRAVHYPAMVGFITAYAPEEEAAETETEEETPEETENP